VGPRELLGQTIDVVEVAVRLVLVLLLQLAVIEGIVVEVAVARGLGAGTADRGIGGVGGTDRARDVRMD
jgi:hypothetical protein